MGSNTTSGSPRPSTPDFERLLINLAEAFSAARIPYMVIGGQAVLHHGRSRFTHEVDLTLGIPMFDAEKVIELLKKIDIHPLAEDPMQFVRMTHVLPSRSRTLDLRVDMSFSDSPYELQAIARGVDVVLDSVPVRFASAEDLVIHKIIAGRPVDHQDVEGSLLKNPRIDAADIRAWLARFAEALEQPLVEAFDDLWQRTRD